ncbi:hypothetical protein [Lacipirellula parvula]|uniref:Helix-turn-helix domain-containing protein n=1 Tax=Lacipirellula parvula TaxID=2650471 RepID=A0A5K7X703_9BACT|nr:hypothetical protein [Lacipirellula parvula]BBO32514.1 hypothetical protein PLANPX_2126 [Lacipirellula parvula]
MKRKPEPELPLLISRPEAARLLGVSIPQMSRLDAAGVTLPLKVGGWMVRYRRADIVTTVDRLADEARGRGGEN